MEYIVAIIIVSLLIFVWKFDDKSIKRKYNKLFLNREYLSTESFYEKYFKSKYTPKNIVFGVKKVLEEQLGTELSKLSAEDDFSKNLNFFFAHDSMADVEIVVGLESEFNIKISDSEAETAHTVNDIINLVCKKIEEKA